MAQTKIPVRVDGSQETILGCLALDRAFFDPIWSCLTPLIDMKRTSQSLGYTKKNFWKYDEDFVHKICNLCDVQFIAKLVWVCQAHSVF